MDPSQFAAIAPETLLQISRELSQPSESPLSSSPSSPDHPNIHSPSLATQVIFLVGKPSSAINSTAAQQQIANESHLFGDILQEDFLDTYNNLTLKSLMLLKWVNNLNRQGETARVKFVMKCDDDTFLNLPNLVHVLLGGTVPIYQDTLSLYSHAEQQEQQEQLQMERRERKSPLPANLLMGFLFRNAKPIRDVTSKWFTPKYMFRKKTFPNYLSGTGYVIEAKHAARELFRAAQRTPLLHLEDVYVTGLCASRSLDTRPHHHPLFSYLKYADRACALRGMITQHPMTTADILTAYDRLASDRKVGVHCDQPSQESLEKLKKNAKSSSRAAQSGGVHGMMMTGIVAVIALGVVGG